MSRHTEITLKMLHAFLVWADSTSEEDAARKLGITQPAVHRKLERFQSPIDSGPRLVQRGRSGWELTPQGRLILPVIRDLLRRFEQLEAHLADRSSAPRVFRIATGQFTAQYILPRAVAALRADVAECQVETHLARGIDRIHGVVNAQFDLAIVTHTSEQVHAIVRKCVQSRERILTCTPLAQYPFVVVAHRDSPEGKVLSQLPQQVNVSLSEIRAFPLVGLDPQSGLRQRLEKLAGGMPLTFASDTRTGGWHAALAYAEQRLGAALVPSPVVPKTLGPGLITRAFDETFTLNEILIKRADFSDSTAEIVQTALLNAARQGMIVSSGSR